MLKFNLKKYFFLLVACTLSSCQQYHRMEIDAHLAKPEMENSSGSITKRRNQEKKTSLPKCVLVLLHGLNMDRSECSRIKEAVEQKFGKDVEIIQSKCREGFKSVYLSIDRQAQKIVAEIKTTLRTRYPKYSEEQLQALPVNLFGYSQGGLVACMVAAKHRDELNIKSVIPAHAPLSGAEVLENHRSDLNKFQEKAKPGLAAIGHPKHRLCEAKILGTLLNKRFLKSILNFLLQGLSDIRIKSKCTGEIKAFIRTPNQEIPMLLMAGCIEDLTEYFDFPEEDKKQVDDFGKAYALLTTRQKDGEHDILISTKSQLSRTDSWKNLATSKDDAVYPTNVAIHIDQRLHCYNLTPILSEFIVHYGQTLFHCEETIKVIVDFIAQHNHLNKEKQ